jgi:hypothetical protein
VQAAAGATAPQQQTQNTETDVQQVCQLNVIFLLIPLHASKVRMYPLRGQLGGSLSAASGLEASETQHIAWLFSSLSDTGCQ